MQYEVKSQDDMNRIEQHSTDDLLAALEKCKKMEIQLGIVIEILLRECSQYEGFIKANFPHYKRG